MVARGGGGVAVGGGSKENFTVYVMFLQLLYYRSNKDVCVCILSLFNKKTSHVGINSGISHFTNINLIEIKLSTNLFQSIFPPIIFLKKVVSHLTILFGRHQNIFKYVIVFFNFLNSGYKRAGKHLQIYRRVKVGINIITLI